MLKKIKIIPIILVVLLLYSVVHVYEYLNQDDARIKDCLDKFAVSLSQGDLDGLASCCTGASLKTIQAISKADFSISGGFGGFGASFGTSLGDLALLGNSIMPSYAKETFEITVNDIEYGDNEALVSIEMVSSKDVSVSDEIKMKKVYGLFWKINEDII